MKFFISLFVSILIVLQSVSSFTNVADELGEILSDYRLHQEKYGDNLATFWAKHYGKLREQHKMQHQKERQEHKHKHKSVINIPHFDFAFISIFIIKKEQVNFQNKKDNFYYKFLYTQFNFKRILHPPRFLA